MNDDRVHAVPAVVPAHSSMEQSESANASGVSTGEFVM